MIGQIKKWGFSRLKIEQRGFPGHAARVTGEGTVFPHHAMAGNNDGKGICAGGGSDGADGVRGSEACRQIAIADGFAIGDGGNLLPDLKLKRGAAEADGDVKLLPFA